jgi:hypothetical protein
MHTGFPDTNLDADRLRMDLRIGQQDANWAGLPPSKTPTWAGVPPTANESDDDDERGPRRARATTSADDER